jgi:photosystem II stability/assembly factor-like uncharacterized protein
MKHPSTRTTARVLLGLVILTSTGWAVLQETLPVGPTPADQARNADLLKGYDYSKYPSAITGYTGQDRQQIVFPRFARATRTRVGPRGNYKAAVAQMKDGRLVLAACRDNNDTDPAKRRFSIFVYESTDTGLHWKQINKTPLFGKEPSLTVLPDGWLVMTAQKTYRGPGSRAGEAINLARSADGGKTWKTGDLDGTDYPRNVIVEPDGSLLLIRAEKSDWSGKNQGSPHLQLCRSKDHGQTWTFAAGKVDWNYHAFGEVSAIRLKSGRMLAALRRQIPRTHGEGFEDTVICESDNGGRTWSKPRVMVNTAEVHVFLTELADGRILATYSDYHLPYGVSAIVSTDKGRTWDREHPARLVLSADLYVGWPVTIQLADHSLLTAYAITAYIKQPPEKTVTEIVRWKLP